MAAAEANRQKMPACQHFSPPVRHFEPAVRFVSIDRRQTDAEDCRESLSQCIVDYRQSKVATARSCSQVVKQLRQSSSCASNKYSRPIAVLSSVILISSAL